MSESLARQWAVVTGASKGIGYGIAKRLLEEGANLVLVARNAADLQDAQLELASCAEPDQSILTKPVDISDSVAVTALFDWARNELPGLNVLIANAGIATMTPFLDVSPAEWESIVAVNLTGTFLCVQQAARVMVEMPAESNRAILVVSSIRALGIRPGLAAYASTKAAVNQLARMAAYELAAHGVRVNTLSPGITVTPMVATTLQTHPEILEERIATIPMGRAGLPADMGEAALFLCQPSSHFITGANLVVDGGENLF